MELRNSGHGGWRYCACSDGRDRRCFGLGAWPRLGRARGLLACTSYGSSQRCSASTGGCAIEAYADPPDLGGAWGEIVAQVMRLHRRKRFHKQRFIQLCARSSTPPPHCRMAW